MDYTDAGTTYNRVQILNGGNNSQIGLSKSFQVIAGDQITVSVSANYTVTPRSAAFGVSPLVGVEGNTVHDALTDLGAALAGVS